MKVLYNEPVKVDFLEGAVEKSRQRCSRQFSVLTYQTHAPRVKLVVALLDGLFEQP